MVLLLFLYVFVAFITIVIGIIYFKLIYPAKKLNDAFRAQGISGEPFIPLLGQMVDFNHARNKNDYITYFDDLGEKHGHIFQFFFGPLVRLFINEPDLIGDVLGRANAPNYEKPADVAVALEKLFGRRNLFLMECSEHDRARRMINPAFHHVNLQSMVSIITDCTAEAIESMIRNDMKSKSVDLQVLFNALTMSIIASSAFGTDFKRNPHARDIVCRTFAQILEINEHRWMMMINQIPLLARLPFWGKTTLDAGNRKVHEFVDQVIADRRHRRSSSLSDGADLLDLLLSAVDDAGKPFTDEEIKEESLAFIFAGSETSGNLLTWMLYVLMTNENILKDVREEVDQVLPNRITPTNEHLSELMSDFF
ncbi:unnamed protein product [Rotaria sp. Silwood2]|nr:unnamed protein product [Rotaria sp. Silwood2]